MVKTLFSASGWISLLLIASLAQAQGPRLTVQAVERPLSEILTEITATTGVVFDLKTDIDELITLQLHDEPLASALRQLLVGHDYLMLHDSVSGQRQLARVMIMARRQTTEDSAAVVAVEPESPPVIELVVRRQSGQPFMVPGRINGQAVDWLIDTGATTVALSETLGQRLGLVRGQARQISTAGGTTTGYTTVLRRVNVGELLLTNVRAIILPAMRSGQQVLLGMNALAEFELSQRGDTLVLRQPRP